MHRKVRYGLLHQSQDVLHAIALCMSVRNTFLHGQDLPSLESLGSMKGKSPYKCIIERCIAMLATIPNANAQYVHLMPGVQYDCFLGSIQFFRGACASIGVPVRSAFWLEIYSG